MKTILLGVALVLFARLAGSLLVVHAAETRPPRMEVLGHTDIGDGAAMYARYLHDNETGQEVVCITAMTHMDGVMSCYLTGRAWK